MDGYAVKVQVEVEVNPTAGASYFRLTSHEVARTVSVGDLTMVDLDDAGEVVGVEFAFASPPTPADKEALFDAFPGLEKTLKHVPL